ncbi:MAG: YmdB family metallophosphoesterase, partial [Hyphomicrobium denitrificans]|nr:YmdB family metallophosphoesterase [Hyphomicrobium denitrificans]
MRLLFLGDIVGRPGRTAICNALPALITRYGIDFVVINGENAAGGFGITEAILNDVLDAGADCVTLGNHSFDQKDTLVFIERHDRLIRPLNYPKGTPGKGSTLLKARNGADVLVINAMGLVFMPDLNCPFRAVDAELTACALKSGADVILVDFHAEAT